MCKKGNGTIYTNCLKQASGGKSIPNVQVREIVGKDGSCYGKRGKILKAPKKVKGAG